MAVDTVKWKEIKEALGESVTLVAVSKTKPAEDIRVLYNLGQRDFGENYVQELVQKRTSLPDDICWHFIGHLQSNKARDVVPFVYLIHGVDSEKLLGEINKQAEKFKRIVPVLLQVHIAREETKFGLDEAELDQIIQNRAQYPSVLIKGLMGMASNTEDAEKVREEFASLQALYKKYHALASENLQFSLLSMGMSGDYPIAIQQGSNLVRIGSLLFGARSLSSPSAKG